MEIISQFKTTKTYPLKSNLYYIVYYGKILKPKLLPIYFTSKAIAKQQIKKEVATQYWRKYEVKKGSQIMDQEWTYMNKRWRLGHERKYFYPPDIVNDKKLRRLFRSKARNRLQFMKMYFVPKTKGYVFNKDYLARFQISRYNHEKTFVKAFQIDRAPDFFFLRLKKLARKYKTELTRLEAIKIDKRTGKHRVVNMNIFHTDIVRPVTVPELYEILLPLKNAKEIIRYCNDNGVRLDFQGSKKFIDHVFNEKDINKKT